MKTFNRTMLILVLAVSVALVWSMVSRSDWAASVSLLGVGENYSNALQPVIKVGAAILVMVSATRLVQIAVGWVAQLRSSIELGSR